ncbi:MAG: hypothetical protein KDF65_00065 [Anaerolineae bacterium]|nr:hypothetical protein [Anaerolineae bacterium]
MKNLLFTWPEIGQNPLWYVATVAALAGIAAYFRFLWWLAALVALLWGGWLLWQMFAVEETLPATPLPTQRQLDQARRYQQQISRLLAGTRRSQAQRQRLVAQIALWLEAIEELAGYLAALQANAVIQSDLATVPEAMRALEAQLEATGDAALRLELARAVRHRRDHWAALAGVQRLTQQAHLHIDNTVAMLGTITSQLLAEQATHQVADYSRLSGEVDEATRRLQDQLEALREVKLGVFA